MCIKKTEKKASSDKKTAILGTPSALECYQKTVNFDVSMGVELSRAKREGSQNGLKGGRLRSVKSGGGARAKTHFEQAHGCEGL